MNRPPMRGDFGKGLNPSQCHPGDSIYGACQCEPATVIDARSIVNDRGFLVGTVLVLERDGEQWEVALRDEYRVFRETQRPTASEQWHLDRIARQDAGGVVIDLPALEEPAPPEPPPNPGLNAFAYRTSQPYQEWLAAKEQWERDHQETDDGSPDGEGRQEEQGSVAASSTSVQASDDNGGVRPPARPAQPAPRRDRSD
jgi:hypothetical protein